MNDNLLTQKAMPVHAGRALAKFTRHNPSYNGADWADVLDHLIDTDANLDVRETIYEALATVAINPANRSLIGPVTLTLFYARTGRYHAPVDPDLVREFVGLVAAARAGIEGRS